MGLLQRCLPLEISEVVVAILKGPFPNPRKIQGQKLPQEIHPSFPQLQGEDKPMCSIPDVYLFSWFLKIFT